MSVQAKEAGIERSNQGLLHGFPWKEYFILVFAGLAGVLAALPSAWNIIGRTAALANIPVQLLAAGQLLQSAFWMLLTVGMGLLLGAKTGLGAPILRAYLAGERVGTRLRSQLVPSTLLALPATVAATALDRWFFLPRLPGFSSAISQVSGWKAILASLYGGITEEILSRLFFVTLLAWTLGRFSRKEAGKPSSAAMWTAIAGSAVVFGLGHLPATLASRSFSMVLLARAVLLNGIYGTLFGYLYWKRGLESSMLSHFTSDLLVHVVLPAL